MPDTKTQWGELPPLAPDHPRNSDVKCLRCDAFNLPENHVCGRCGASLPMVYDEEGKIFNWRSDPYFKALVDLPAQRRKKTEKVGKVTIAFGVTLFLVFILSQVLSPAAGYLLVRLNLVIAVIFAIYLFRRR